MKKFIAILMLLLTVSFGCFADILRIYYPDGSMKEYRLAKMYTSGTTDGAHNKFKLADGRVLRLSLGVHWEVWEE